MRAWGLLAAATLLLMGVTGCTSEPAAVQATQQEAPPAPSPEPVLVKVATAAELGEPMWLDKSIYFGPPQGGCVLGPADKMVCLQRSGSAAPHMNAIIGQSQLRNPLSLEQAPPVAIPGITGNDRVLLNRVLAAPGGFVFLYQSDPIDRAYQLSFVTDQGAQLWVSTLPAAPRDLAVTKDELLIGPPDGVSSLKLSDGTPGATQAKAGTLLAGTTPERDGFSSYAPGVVGLSRSDGGTVLNAVDVHGSQWASCEFTGAAGCTPTRVLYADSEYLVVEENAGAGGPTSAYDAKGTKLWTVDQPLTSAVRFQDAFVLGYAGPTKNTSLPAGRMAVVSALAGTELVSGAAVEGGSAYVAGVTAGGVIYGFDGPGVPGTYDVSYSVLPITLTVTQRQVAASATAAAPVPSAAGTVSGTASAPATASAPGAATSSAAGWTTRTTEAGGFSFDLPTDWTVSSTPAAEPAGARTVATDPSGAVKFEVIEGISGLGGACGPGGSGQDEAAVLLRLPVKGLNLASPSISSQTPTVTVIRHGPNVGYTVKDVKPAAGSCDMYPFIQWQPAGTSGFSASISTTAYARTSGTSGTADAPMSGYLKSAIHSQLLHIFLSIQARK